MNSSRQTPFKVLTVLLCLIAIGVNAQKKTKNFKETFIVSSDALLDINTSHADLEFETWSKNVVEIEAFIEIEDVTDEEAEEYFENSGFEIFGNSKKVSVATASKNREPWSNVLGDVKNFHIEIPELPEVNAYSFDFDFEELKDMPLPPVPAIADFDHKAFKKDGDQYLKQWKKEFDENYDEEHLKRLEEWAKRMEEKREKIAQKREEMMEKRTEMHEKRVEKLAERQQKRVEAQIELQAAQNERRERHFEMRSSSRFGKDSTNIFFFDREEGKPNIFYGSSDGLHKNYKVKKTIKVRMPKGLKIKMNVRHGEVKLAENTLNINATLSHSSLWATTIDGDKTTIDASYSPISIQNWNYGQLQAKYSENVALKEVLNLRLNATSSNVTIDRLINGAFIKNDFGPIQIKSISSNFKVLDIALQNAELDCKIPDVPFTIYVNGTSSKLTSPANISLDRTKNHNNTVHRGFFKRKSAEGAIVINSKYSDVVLE